MRMIIVCAVLAGCSQAQPASKEPPKEEKKFVTFQQVKDMDLKALESRLASMEATLARIETQMRVSAEDRHEVISYNQCKTWCDEKYPWPMFDSKSGMDHTEWLKLPSVEKAQENSRKCFKECEKRRPKASMGSEC